MKSSIRAAWRSALWAMPLALVACGGGGDDAGGGAGAPLSCSVADQQQWLRNYVDESYFWYALSPKPSPSGSGSVATYFDSLLYTGGDAIPNGAGARWPEDRYSGYESTESFNRFYGAGQTLGYGVAVAGLEVTTPTPEPGAPLYVRYVEPRSPAATAGVVRGDRVISINATPVSTLIAANDFAALTPAAAGNTLTLALRNVAGTDRTVVLTAAVYTLTPVQNRQIVQSIGGRSIGYLTVKDMIEQTAAPLADAFASFRASNVQELVLDLRYNGGGLVSVASEVASYAAGSRANGQVFARLLYNDKKSASNRDYTFGNPASWAGLAKVYVLAGPRTCSASEQVVNGLRGVGVNVVAIGDTTCGKPVGFLPQSDGCGTTYSVVNFESVNARNEGRYFDGFQATCQVAEDFTRPIGAATDPLLVAAAYHADNGVCPAGTGLRESPQLRLRPPAARYRGADGGERTGMSAR